MLYNWQRSDWPKFTFDERSVVPLLENYLVQVDLLQNKIERLPESDLEAFMLERIVEEASSTSSIEGDQISREQLMSSLLNNLTMGKRRHEIRDMRATGITRQIESNRQTWDEPLTETTLKYWHQLLLGHDKNLRVIGDYRKGEDAMQVISGPATNLTVHYEAPPAKRLRKEMQILVKCCNERQRLPIENIKTSGVAHLWFESIHPFEDGNGRIGRALIEKLLSQVLRRFIPFSISHAIEAKRNLYYASLKASQTGTDITPWMKFFGECLADGVAYADTIVDFTVKKHLYYTRFRDQLSSEEAKVIAKMFESGPEGFQGGMSARKYVSINRVSRATATRALQRLADIGALVQRGQRRGTHYVLPFEENRPD